MEINNGYILETFCKVLGIDRHIEVWEMIDLESRRAFVSCGLCSFDFIKRNVLKN